MPKNHHPNATEQTAIEGTEPPDQVYNRKIETRGRAYAHDLSQRQAWQASENNRKVKLDEAMEEAGVTEYFLKDGTRLSRTDGKPKITVKFPKTDDGGVEAPDMVEIT